MIELFITMKITNPLNGSQRCWQKKARLRKAQRKAVALFLGGKKKPALPVVVTLARFGPNKRPMDTDGLPAALKSVRDQVAEWLGVDDADKRIAWSYRQHRAKEYSVMVQIVSVTRDCDDLTLSPATAEARAP